MTLSVHSADPHDPEATRLLEASHALMNALFPADSCHYLEIDDLCAPGINFVMVRHNDKPIGCGALATKDGYGEIKSMFVDPEARGLGAADTLLSHLVTLAKTKNMCCLRLETGDTLKAAHKLYEKHGFNFRGPFGDYPEHPASMFMEKPL